MNGIIQTAVRWGVASVLAVTISTFFFSCDKNPAGPNQPPAAPIGDVVKDTVVNASAGAVTVSVPNAVSILIPQGAVPAGARVKIVKVFARNVALDSSMTIGTVYDVSISSGSQFTAPLTISLAYDPALSPPAGMPNAIGAAYFHEVAKRWTVYPTVTVDTVAHTVTFQTSHLTKLSSWSLSGYTDWMSTLHFNVYWNATGPDAPPSDAVYNNKPVWHVGTDPDFIQDLAFSLDSAYNAYKAAGLQVPTSMVNVYVKAMTDNGLEGFFGSISISNTVSGINIKPPMWEALQGTAAHEFMHYVQDYYYMQLFADYTTKWWMEATATLADRIVYPTGSYFESVDYTDLQLDQFMQRSWDDCNADPNYYVAGGFLTYLSTYRSGTKASIPQLIINGGSNTSISYMRTTIDDYCKQTLGSPGVGAEFADYIKWAYEGLGVIRLARPATASAACDIDCGMTNSSASHPVTIALTHLSARIAKIYMKENTIFSHNLTVKAKTIPSGMRVFAYTEDALSSSMVFYKELVTGDSLKMWIHRGPGLGKVRVDLLIVNADKDKSLTPDIGVAIDAQESVPFSVQDKIDGYCLGVHGNQVLVTVSGTITGPVGVRVIKSANTASDGIFEYPARTLTITVSPQAFSGVIQNLSVHFSKPSVEDVDSLIAAGWEWTWGQFDGGQVDLHSSDDDSWSHPAFTGSDFSTTKTVYVWGADTHAGATTTFTQATGSMNREYSYLVTFAYQ